MEPTYRNGELVICFKLPHLFNRLPAYGDIVAIDPRNHYSRSIVDDFVDVFENGVTKIKNEGKEHIWIKRVIGLPGDRIEFRDGIQVYRNNQPLVESYLTEPMSYQNKHIFVVPENSIFVLGDNRNHSVDSRYIGYIPINHVLGIVIGIQQ